MKNPETSVIILTKNAGKKFKKVLSKIFYQNYQNFEVIIIDSGSTDNTLEIANKYPIKIIKIKPEEFGHGKTRNLGAKLAKGKYAVFLTHDAIPKDKNWLLELITPLKKEKIAGVYSRQLPKESENEIDKFFYFSLYPNKNKIWNKDNYSQGDNIFSDVSSAIKRDLLLKCPFDNNIIVTEDYEWAKRILKKGYKILYNSKSKVTHSHSYNLKSLFKRNFDIGISYQKIYANKDKNNKNSSFIKKGLKIHKAELGYLIKSKKSYLIPYAILKDLTKFVAVNLGKNSHLLPNSINKRFSNYRRYWKK